MIKADYEQELIRGFLAGESRACDMVNAWITAVLEFRSWHLSIRAARDDIRQEVLMALIENFRQKKYKGLGLKTYVSSVTKFTCLKAFDRRPSETIDEQSVNDEKSSSLEEIIRNEEHCAVGKALRQLSEKCRKILALRFHNDLSHNQIARILDIKVAMSRQWLKRCLDRLRELVPRENSV